MYLKVQVGILMIIECVVEFGEDIEILFFCIVVVVVVVDFIFCSKMCLDNFIEVSILVDMIIFVQCCVEVIIVVIVVQVVGIIVKVVVELVVVNKVGGIDGFVIQFNWCQVVVGKIFVGFVLFKKVLVDCLVAGKVEVLVVVEFVVEQELEIGLFVVIYFVVVRFFFFFSIGSIVGVGFRIIYQIGINVILGLVCYFVVIEGIELNG